MNWEHIKYFISVAKHGSANAASNELGVNHTTVIRKLDQLESDLQLKLFIRSSSGYQLSTLGTALLEKAASMEQAGRGLEREAKSFREKPVGVLNISLPENTLIDLSKTFSQFIRLYPHIQLQLNAGAKLSNLNQLEADIALRLTNNPPPELVGRELLKVHFSAYASAQYLSQWPSMPTPKQCQWALWQGSTSSLLPEAHHPDLLLSQEKLGPVVLRSSNTSDVLACVKQHAAVGLIADNIALDHNLIKLPFDNILIKNKLNVAGLWLLRHKDLIRAEPAKTFCDFISQELG
ncbi:MAG: LysR family transcriptional regulator [Sinobacterium sp.]|nr:LysR family transcriptional regulator [Sinobacterium sp.]